MFDAVISESHDYEALITDHPIEAGANPIDNIVIQPVLVTLNIFVGSIYSTSFFSIAQGKNRPTDALGKLRQMMVDREPLTLVCRLASYDNMMIKSVVSAQDVDSSTSLLATVTLQEGIFVDSSTGSIDTNPSDPQYSQEINGGTKQSGVVS